MRKRCTDRGPPAALRGAMPRLAEPLEQVVGSHCRWQQEAAEIPAADVGAQVQVCARAARARSSVLTAARNAGQHGLSAYEAWTSLCNPSKHGHVPAGWHR